MSSFSLSSFSRCTLLLALLAALPHSGTAREFTNAAGQKIEAEIAAVDGDFVILLKTGGKRFRYATAKLSAEDQAYVSQWAEENATISVRITCAQEVFDRKRLETEGGRLYNEKRGYKVTVHNNGPEEIKGLVCHYRMFKANRDKASNRAQERNLESAQVDGKHALPPIVGRGSYTFTTKGIDVKKGRYLSGGRAHNHRENLNGINLHLYKGTRLAAEHYIGAYKAEGTEAPEAPDADDWERDPDREK